MLTRTSARRFPQATRRLFKCFSLQEQYLFKEGLIPRTTERVQDIIRDQKSEFSNLTPNIESLTDRVIFKQEGHPVNTLSRK